MELFFLLHSLHLIFIYSCVGSVCTSDVCLARAFEKFDKKPRSKSRFFVFVFVGLGLEGFRFRFCVCVCLGPRP